MRSPVEVMVRNAVQFVRVQRNADAKGGGSAIGAANSFHRNTSAAEAITRGRPSYIHCVATRERRGDRVSGRAPF
jgi:hypothetical protein